MGRGQLTVSLATAAIEVRVWRSSEPTPFFVSLEAVAQIPRPPASAPLIVSSPLIFFHNFESISFHHPLIFVHIYIMTLATV